MPFYLKDLTRREDIEDAQKISEAIREAYLEFRYNIIEVPVLPLEERVKRVIRLAGIKHKTLKV